MLKFVVNTIRVLAEIPGASAAGHGECLRTLDVEAIDMGFDAMSREGREAMSELYLSVQALIGRQHELQLEADKLIGALVEQLIRFVPYDMATDDALRGGLVHRDLCNIVNENSAEDNKVLLVVARSMMADTPASEDDTTAKRRRN